MQDTLVIGFGSIGKRHARVLRLLGHRVSVVSRHAVTEYPCYSKVGEAISNSRPSYAVIATETSHHRLAYESLLETGFAGRILIEKPLGLSPKQWTEADDGKIRIGYNLRFHPMMQRLRDLLKGETVLSFRIDVGRYLPEWRPDSDYRKSSSASKDAGGGVLRDLSHELDYTCWFLGPWTRLAAIGGRFGNLEIDTDDGFAILMATERCPMVTVNLN